MIMLTLYQAIMTLNDPDKVAFWKLVEKGDNAGNQHFLFLSQCLLPLPKQNSLFESYSICRLPMLSISTSPQLCPLVKI